MIAFVLAAAVAAHQVGLSRGTWTQEDAGVNAELVFKADETPTLAKDALEGIVVRVQGAPCAGAIVGADTVTESDGWIGQRDGLAVRLRFRCDRLGRVTVEMGGLLSRLTPGHRHLGKAFSVAGEHDVIASSEHSVFTFGEPAKAASYLWLGVEHILLGFDHLVFLFGVVLVGGRMRSLVAVITAFTCAHSITLAASVLGVWAPSSSVVEPLIALSIAYVGIENFFVQDASRRWRITAPFGLIHGFGFASALAETGIPRDEAPLILLLFNLGVEAGQLVALALVLPVLHLLRAKGILREGGTRALSVGVLLLGLAWLVERIVP